MIHGKESYLLRWQYCKLYLGTSFTQISLWYKEAEKYIKHIYKV